MRERNKSSLFKFTLYLLVSYKSPFCDYRHIGSKMAKFKDDIRKE